MNYVDALIAIPLVWGAFNGFRKGLIIEVASLVALIAGIYGAIEFSVQLSIWLNRKFDWSENLSRMLAFIFIFVGIMIIVHLIARIIEKMAKLAALGTVNRIFGLFFGTMKYVLIVGGICYIFEVVDSRYPFIKPETKEDSMLYGPVSKLIPLIYPGIGQEMEETQSIIA